MVLTKDRYPCSDNIEDIDGELVTLNEFINSLSKVKIYYKNKKVKHEYLTDIIEKTIIRTKKDIEYLKSKKEVCIK